MNEKQEMLIFDAGFSQGHSNLVPALLRT